MRFMCIVISYVVWRGYFLWPVHSLGKTVSLCPALFCTPRPNLTVIPAISWLPTFVFQSPMMKRTSFCGVSSRRSCGFTRPFNFILFCISAWGIDLDYFDIEWFALETNRDHFGIFETVYKYCILDCFVGFKGYSISSKGFLPTVVDIMVIWFKFTNFSSF